MGFEQLSLFDIEVKSAVTAVCCMDRKSVAVKDAESWMRRIVPRGEYVVDVGTHPLVLQPVKLSEDSIPKGHEFYHYLIGKEVYAGVFIGKENGYEIDD